MSVALLFSPQGSQTVGMGQDLADAWPAAAAVYADANAALDWAVSDVCWNGPDDRLNDTRQTQPCLVATSLACLAALREACMDAGVTLAPALVRQLPGGAQKERALVGAALPTPRERVAPPHAEREHDAPVDVGN